MTQTTWRPAADSMRNLAGFWLAVGGAATVGALATIAPTSRAAVAVVVAAAAFAGAIVAVVVSRPRFEQAMEHPERADIGGWRPTPEATTALARAGLRNALMAFGFGIVVGTIGGVIPSIGIGVAAAGAAGAAGTAVAWRTVRRFEATHDAVVLSARAERGERRRPPLRLTVVAR